MFGLGMSEIIFLAILALIVIGPKELPEVARTVGRFLNELKRSTNVLGEELKQQARVDRIDFNEPPPRTPQSTSTSQEAPAEQAGAEEKKEEHKPS